MREVGPRPQGIYATSQVLDTVANSLNCKKPDELRRGLNLIEYMGHEGLELDLDLDLDLRYDPFLQNTRQEHKRKSSFLEMCDAASVDTCGQVHDSDSDMDSDETGSLMDCGDGSVLGPGGPGTKFNLYKLLEAIQTRHVRVSSGFQAAQVRLEGLREQNRQDKVFLGKLSASNERVGEKIHDMKVEVSGIFRELELLKKPVAVGQSLLPVHAAKFPLESWFDNCAGPQNNNIITTDDLKPNAGNSVEQNSLLSQEIATYLLSLPSADAKDLHESKLDLDNFTGGINAASPTRLSNIDVKTTAFSGPLVAGVPVLLAILVACWIALAFNLKMVDGK